jgi:hypothetical protein
LKLPSSSKSVPDEEVFQRDHAAEAKMMIYDVETRRTKPQAFRRKAILVK